MQSLSELSIEESSYKNEEGEYEVEKILKQRTRNEKDKKTGQYIKVREYLVKWVGYSETTWEPEDNLINCQELLKDFLISQIMKKLKSTKNPKKIGNKITGNKKRKTPDNTSEEEQEIDSTTFSNTVNVNNKRKKINKEDIKESQNDDRIFIDIENDDEECEEKNDNLIVNKNKKENKKDLGIKILRINYMKIPEKIGEGIILSVKYEKKGKTFIDTFNTKTEEIPKECLVEYYEKFICDNFKGKFEEEMDFE